MEDFKWTDDLVKEFVVERFSCFYNERQLKLLFECFKASKSKEPKKEYEILKSCPIEGDFVYKAPNPPEKETEKEYEILSCCPISGDIYSVKRLSRLSDGEVFTLGDKILFENNPITYTIEKFTIRDNCLTVSVYGLCPLFNIFLINKIKNPLFTTEDEVAITDEKQTLYAVITKAQWQTREDTVKRMRERSGFSAPLNPSWKYFSTEAARADYILMNKPLLSANDIITIGHTWLLGEGGEESRYCPYFSHSKLIDLAKSKL